MKAARVGLIGARRARQGLGPFVARELRSAGAEIPCFLVSGESSLVQAREQLAQIAGVEARGYVDLDAMLRSEELDALAICTPHETHLPYLEAALRAGLHCLCEKPLVWGVDDIAGHAARIASAFAASGLLLRENCPWTHVLPAFARLYPGSLVAPPRRFAMHLQPAGRGARMLADALPHPLSLLQALVPGRDPSASDVGFSEPGDAEELAVAFTYRTGRHAVRVEIALQRTDAHPRHVWVAIDGRRADRLVSPPDYRLSLRGEGRTVPLDDPLTRLVGDFVREIESPAHPTASGHEIAERMALLGEIVDAWVQATA